MDTAYMMAAAALVAVALVSGMALGAVISNEPSPEGIEKLEERVELLERFVLVLITSEAEGLQRT